MDETDIDARKRLFRALTSVLERSGVGDEVDPKSFLVLLNGNHAVLVRDRRMDLRPLWGTLAGQVDEQDIRLTGLFLGFASSCTALGFEPTLPESVAALDGEARAAAEREVFGINGQDGTASLDEADEPPPLLETGDLRPVVSEELRRETIRLVVQCLKSSEAGPLIDGAQLAYRVDAFFDRLCDGERFDLRPIMQGLREIGGLSDADVFVGIARLEQRLAELGLALDWPELDVSEVERDRLLAAAKAAETVERRRVAPQRASSTLVDAPAPPLVEGRRPKRDERLRRYGLLGWSSARWRTVRLLVLAAVLTGAAVGAWVTRPDQSFDPGQFEVPFVRAGLSGGQFVAHLDERRWYALSRGEREAKAASLRAWLEGRGLASRAQVFDQKGRLVMRAGTDTAFAAARFVLESPDGIQAPPPGKKIDPKDAAKRKP